MRPKGQIFDLKRFREVYNLTQKEIALAVNRPQSFLSAIEHGKRSAPPGFLDDLSRLYDVDNISDYIRDREEPQYGNIEGVRNAIVNSPGGTMLLNEFGGKLTQQEIRRILEIEQQAMMQELSAPSPPSEASTVAELVKMLSEMQARCYRAEDRVKELEKEILALQAQLPKKKK